MSKFDPPLPPLIAPKRTIVDISNNDSNESIISPAKKRRKTNMTLHSKLIEEFAKHSHIRNAVNLSSYHAKKQNIKTLCPFHDMLPVLNIMEKELFNQTITTTNSMHISCEWCCSGSPYKAECRNLLLKTKELYEYKFDLNDIVIPFMNSVVLGGPTPNICIKVNTNKNKLPNKNTITFAPLQNLPLSQRKDARNIAVKAISCGTFKRNLQPIPGPCRITKLLDGDGCFVPIKNSHCSDIFMKVSTCAVKQRRKFQGTDSVLGVGFDCASTTNWNKARIYWMHRSVYTIKDKNSKRIVQKKQISNRDLRFSVLMPYKFIGNITVYMLGVSHSKTYELNMNELSDSNGNNNNNSNSNSNNNNNSNDDVHSNIPPLCFDEETMVKMNENTSTTVPSLQSDNNNGNVVSNETTTNTSDNLGLIVNTDSVNNTDNIRVTQTQPQVQVQAQLNSQTAALPLKTIIKYPFDTNMLNNNTIINNMPSIGYNNIINNNNVLNNKIDQVKCIENDLENGNNSYINLLKEINFKQDDHQTLASKWIKICLLKYNSNEDIYHSYLLNLFSTLISNIGAEKTVRGLKRLWIHYNNVENEWSFLHMICSKNLLYLFQSILNLFVSMKIKHEILLSTVYASDENSKLKIAPIYCCIVNNNYQFTKYLFDYFLSNLQSYEILNILSQTHNLNTNGNVSSNSSSLINELINYNHAQTLQQLINKNSCQINPFLNVQQIRSILNVINNYQQQKQQQQYLINCYKYQ